MRVARGVKMASNTFMSDQPLHGSAPSPLVGDKTFPASAMRSSSSCRKLRHSPRQQSLLAQYLNPKLPGTPVAGAAPEAEGDDNRTSWTPTLVMSPSPSSSTATPL